MKVSQKQKVTKQPKTRTQKQEKSEKPKKAEGTGDQIKPSVDENEGDQISTQIDDTVTDLQVENGDLARPTYAVEPYRENAFDVSLRRSKNKKRIYSDANPDDQSTDENFAASKKQLIEKAFDPNFRFDF